MVISTCEHLEDEIMDLEAVQEELREKIDKIQAELEINEIDFMQDYEFELKGVK